MHLLHLLVLLKGIHEHKGDYLARFLAKLKQFIHVPPEIELALIDYSLLCLLVLTLVANVKILAIRIGIQACILFLSQLMGRLPLKLGECL